MIKYTPLLAILLVGCAHSGERNIYVKAGSYVKHTSGSNYNEDFNNRGVGAEAEVYVKEMGDGSIVYSIGYINNKNSYDVTSHNLHGAVKYCHDFNYGWRLCGGAAAGGATGYSRQTRLAVTPWAAPIASIERGRLGLDVMWMPSFGRVDGFYAVQFKYKVLTW
jgi:hypothetical protein